MGLGVAGLSDTVLHNSCCRAGFQSQIGILAGPGVGHLMGLGVGGLNDTALQNSCCGTG